MPSSENRGLKRKSKVDPYEDMDMDDEVQRTPAAHRANSRNTSSAAPTPSARVKSTGKMIRRSRSSLIEAKASPAAKSPASTPALPKAPNAVSDIIAATTTRQRNVEILQREEEASKVVEAPMMAEGDAIVALNDDDMNPTPRASEPASDVELGTIRAVRMTSEGNDAASEELGEREPEAEESAEEPEAAPEEAAEETPEEEEGEEHELKALVKHRYTDEGVELLVHWAGETLGEATWEPEEEIQKGADEMLYEYWGKHKGRTAALFEGKNAPPEQYHVFKVLRHEKKPKNGGFLMEVQWVGYSATALDTTLEPESKLRKIAPTLLDEYWDSLGGRDAFLSKRGRGKKPRIS